jgi:hypothetical protein
VCVNTKLHVASVGHFPNIYPSGKVTNFLMDTNGHLTDDNKEEEPVPSGEEEEEESDDIEPEERDEDDDEDDEDDEDYEDDEEPSLKYKRIGGALDDLLKKDSASALAISNKLLVSGLPFLW